MIQTFSTTIRRKEMDSVLTCMVDEKIGPGEINARLIQAAKEFFSCAGALAFRSPDVALKYALRAINLEASSAVMISALAPSWQLFALEQAGYKPLVLDVDASTAQLTADIVSDGIKNGGRALVLREALGILPDFEAILSLGIPVIEDVSQSAGGLVAQADEEGAGGSGSAGVGGSAAGGAGGEASSETDAAGSKSGKENTPKGKKVSSFGIFSICALEENDTITAGGGALLMAHSRRDWPVLKSLSENIPLVEMLPDINAALALTQIKEFNRNEQKRKELYKVFSHSVMAGKNRTFARDLDACSTVWSFPLVLNGSYKDVRQYAHKKDIEVRQAFADSVFAVKSEELASECKNAKTLFLRTALFPLYPRLNKTQVEKIAKVLTTLP